MTGQDRMKRWIDLVLCAAAAPVAAPLAALVALLVRCTIGRPVLFRQRRTGRADVAFDIVKFRTMDDGRAEDGSLLPDEQRLTRVGRILRTTSLDELPELWNVLRGDMSLVGPRPLPVTYLSRYTAEERRRHDVRPGITGWAQVNGRNATTWEDRLAMDVWYVDNRSTWLDLRILARTITAVLRRDGISAEGHATMPELRPPPDAHR